MVAFNPEVRKKILVMKPEERVLFTQDELELVANMPDNPADKDELDEFFAPEKGEYRFWERFQYNPDIWKTDNFKFYVPGYKK